MILNDSGKSDTQKDYDIYKLIDAETIATSSVPEGDLNLTIRHVPEFGAAELAWDSTVEVGACQIEGC